MLFLYLLRQLDGVCVVYIKKNETDVVSVQFCRRIKGLFFFSTTIEGLTPISITLTVFNFLLSNRISMLHFMAVLETGQGWLCIVTNE